MWEAWSDFNMKNCIDELKKEHTQIISLLSDIIKVMISQMEDNSGDEFFPDDKFRELRTILTEHVHKEHDKIFSVLRENSAHNELLMKNMTILGRDIEKVTENAVKVVDNYKTKQSNVDYARAFGKIFIDMGAAIRREEDILFDEYAKIKEEAESN